MTIANAKDIPLSHNEIWHSFCSLQKASLYHIETYCYETVSKGKYSMEKHERENLAIRFFNLSFKKQLVILFSLYVMFIFCSLLVQIV